MDDNFFMNAFDLDGDGLADAFDSNGDGTPDAFDTDGDGRLDLFDVNYDGILDTTVTPEDSDGDGIADMLTQTTYLDTNGDGIVDTITMMHDTNGDGLMDSVDILQDIDGDGILDLIQPVLIPGIEPDGPNPYDPFQPEHYQPDHYHPGDSDNVVGEPEEDMEHWEFQGDTPRCAVFAQMFAIEELTGEDIDPNQLTRIAEEHGWFDNGTPPDCMGKLLEYYGLRTETGRGTIDDIEDCLDHGGKVIVGLDSSEIWEGPDHETMFSPGQQADHAVEVIGIDYADPDHPMVILNDSGTLDGAGETVPLDQFMDAWQDSGCLMVEAYK